MHRSYIKYPRAAMPSSWDIRGLCSAYDWPTNAPGGGKIAIIELGGGWIIEDVARFCADAQILAPTVTDVSVDGTKNSRCNPQDGADGEVALDIQVAAGAYSVATGKAAEIRVYWAANSNPNSIADGIAAAVNDGCDTCSISWGSPEYSWGKSLLAMEKAAIKATEAGMIVFAAAGDSDSSDGDPSDPEEVDGPSCCPHVIACGGTRKPKNGEEVVWGTRDPDGSGTGGGFSKIFPMPTWLNGAPHGSGRMTPDITANADPESGFEIYLYNNRIVVGGTSAVAPLYAGLFSAFGTKLGFVTPKLWKNQGAFVDILHGTNGAYRASHGADPCSGVGRAIGERVAKLFL